jgi:hypothetical protein
LRAIVQEYLVFVVSKQTFSYGSSRWYSSTSDQFLHRDIMGKAARISKLLLDRRILRMLCFQSEIKQAECEQFSLRAEMLVVIEYVPR